MARIKGKWVGQVVVEFEVNAKCDIAAQYVANIMLDNIPDSLKDDMENYFDGDAPYKVTVTQLHADLYRDEPSEWTKEEAT